MAKRLSFSTKLKNLKIWIKRIIILILIPFLLIYFLILDKGDKNYSRVSAPIVETTNIVSRVVFYPIRLVKIGFNNFTETLVAKSDNKALVKELEELKGIKLENDILKQENIRLSELLNQAPHQTRPSIVANIIHDSENSLHHTFILTAGRKLGVKTGMAVLSPTGELVGVITIAGKNYSRAIALTDLSSSIPVRVPGLNIQGFIKGNNSTKPIFELYNDPNFIPEVGMPIMTSGIYGTMPANLPIGYISKIFKNKSSAIQLYSNVDSIYSVRIVPFDIKGEYKNAIKDLEASNETL